MNFKTKYRIVRLSYSWYVAQYQPWWMPFVWYECFGVNRCLSNKEAEGVCKEHAEEGSV
jgi:hypothetical protein